MHFGGRVIPVSENRKFSRDLRGPRVFVRVAFVVMLEVIIMFIATLRLCAAPFNIGADTDTMEDALEMPAACTISAMAFAATAMALGRKRWLSTSVSTPPPVPLRLFRRTADSSALPADPKSGYDLPSPHSKLTKGLQMGLQTP